MHPVASLRHQLSTSLWRAWLSLRLAEAVTTAWLVVVMMSLAGFSAWLTWTPRQPVETVPRSTELRAAWNDARIAAASDASLNEVHTPMQFIGDSVRFLPGYAMINQRLALRCDSARGSVR